MDDTKTEIITEDKGSDVPDAFLLDYLIILLKRKTTVLFFSFFAGIFTLAYAFTIPDMYTATTRLLVPQKSDQGTIGLLSKIPGNALGNLMGTSTAAEIYVGILGSRSVADRIIEKFDLKRIYGKKSLKGTREMLKKKTQIESGEGQILHISVKDTKPRRAAEMANAYADELDLINQRVSITEGRLKRVFLEKRLKRVKKDLLDAENRLKEFQEKYRLVALDEQAKATIEGAAQIKGAIIAAQTELEVFKEFGTEKNTEALRLKSRINGLTSQLSRIEDGNSHNEILKSEIHLDRAESNFYIPFNKLPALGMELVRLTRRAKIQEEVYKLLTSQFELAKIEEARDINTIQVLDKAIPPDRISGPNRPLIILLCTVTGGVMGILVAFFGEFLERLKLYDPKRYRMLSLSLRIGNQKS